MGAGRIDVGALLDRPTFRRPLSDGRRKSLKQFSIGLAHRGAIFRMPLDRHGERRARFLDRFDDAIVGYGRHDETLAQALDSLMVPRIHIESAPADDLSQSGTWRNPDSVRRRVPAGLRTARFHPVRIDVRHMLDQRSTANYVEELRAPANTQHWEILSQSFLEQLYLKLVALVLRRLALRSSWPAIKLRIHVAATREQKPVQPVQGSGIPHGSDAGFFQRCLVWP